MNRQTIIRHRHIIIAHFRGADGMKDGGRNVAGQFCQFRVGGEFRAPLEFHRRASGYGGRAHQAARVADAVGGYFAVIVGGEIVGLFGRCLIGIA